MEDPKVLTMEVTKNGETLNCEATFTSRHWAAKIRDEQGNLRGEVSMVFHGAPLHGQALEAAVHDWVWGCVRNNVGFS